MLDILQGANPPPYLRDEVVLAMAAILNTQRRFYHILVRFLAEHDLAPALAMDEAESAYEFFKTNLGGRKGTERKGVMRNKKDELALLSQKAESIQSAVSSFVHDHKAPALARWILELPDHPFSRDPSFAIAQTIFPEVLLDDTMQSYQRLNLLIIHWAAIQLRNWTNRLKNPH